MKISNRKYQLNKCENHIYQENLKDKKVMLPLRNNLFDSYSRYYHTVDVKKTASKIAESLQSKGLNLNTDYIELMCDWHDVGHCPFGHAGEEKLNSLLSENDMFYNDSFFSGYKHNLLSAKILLKEHPDIPWIVIDGIIKHTSVLPKNFNVSRVQNDNLLKLNYIFKTKQLPQYKHVSWESFITQDFSTFPCCNCKAIKYPITNKSNSHIELCNASTGYCCTTANFSNDVFRNNIVKYLLYPYPLSYEGEVLYWADEITALTNDIYRYCDYINKHHKIANRAHILQQSIINTIELLKAQYNNVPAQFFMSLETLTNSNATQNDLNDVIDYFTNKINATPNSSYWGEQIDNIKAQIVSNLSNGCQRLLQLESNALKIMQTLKKSIYSLIHGDRIVLEDNKRGVDALEKCFFYYYNDPQEFFKQIKSTLQKELKSLTSNLSNQKSSVKTLINNSKVSKIRDGEKLLNAFRREIIFYLANQTEKHILDLAQTL